MNLISLDMVSPICRKDMSMPHYLEYKMPKKTIRDICRCCGNGFAVIRGLDWCDNRCCGAYCYVSVGKETKLGIIKIEHTTTPKNWRPPPKNKKSRKQRKKARPGRKWANDPFYKSKEWRSLRYEVLKKYGRKCMLCACEVGQMHVDHIQPRSRRPDLQLSFGNLQVLCQECNMGKGSKMAADFRPKVAA